VTIARSSSANKPIILVKLGETGCSSLAESRIEIVDKAHISCLLKLSTPSF
jgi:hypothetical protein